MNYIEIIGFMAAFCTTFSFLPQAFKTIKSKDTSGISLAMYAIFTCGTTFWLIYGVLILSWPMIVANTITTLFAAVILGYKIKYK